MLDNTHHPLPASPEFDRRKSLRGGGGVSRSETEGVYKNATSHNDNQSLHLTRSLLRLSLLLIAAFTGVVVLIHARPYDDSELRAFLLPPEGCPAPCWQGIRPNLTSVDEAFFYLSQIQGMRFSYEFSPFDARSGGVHWEWENVTQAIYGSMDFTNLIVTNVTIHMPYGRLWLSLGNPDGGQYWGEALFNTDGSVIALPDYHWTYYRSYYFTIHTKMRCVRFWREISDIWLAASPEEILQANPDMITYRRFACDQTIKLCSLSSGCGPISIR